MAQENVLTERRYRYTREKVKLLVLCVNMKLFQGNTGTCTNYCLTGILQRLIRLK